MRGKLNLGKFEGLQKLLKEDLSRMGWDTVFRNHAWLLVIVHEAYVVCVFVFPPKDDAPLVINSNTMQTFEITAQGFKPIPWRSTQVCELPGSIEEIELSNGGR
jgi:hypothetical protein